MDYSEENFVVFGDNLEIMARLADESFDLVYLDPPWNKYDFSYSNQNDEKKYQEFIFKVIQQSHRLLKPRGNLVLYSNPSLNVNFHNLLRPVFNSSNFKAEIIIPRKRISYFKEFSHNHDTVLFYSKGKESKFYPFIERTEKEVKEQFPLEENGRRFRLEPLTAPRNYSNLNFEWNGFRLPEGKVWKYTAEKLNKLEKENKIYYKEDLYFPKRKRFYDQSSQKLVDSVWPDINPYQKDKITGIYFQSPSILKRIINISSQKGGKILDPFAGSGVSGIVANQLSRKWFGIERIKDFFSASTVEFQVFNEENFILDNDIVWDDYISYNLSEAEILKEKISKGENQRIEFKEAYLYNIWENRKDKELPDKVMKEIAGFLNTKYGGSIFLGVKDKGEIRGLTEDFEHANPQKKNFDAFELSLSDKIKHTFTAKILDFLEISSVEIDKKTICEIKISPSKTPVFFKSEYIVRQGTKAQQLTNQEMYELLKLREQIKT